LNKKDLPLAIAPGLPFSRYVPGESIDSDAPDDSVFRLLVVFASPDNLPPDQKPIDVEADLSSLLDGIDALAEGRRFRLVVMPGRTRISDALRKRLASSGIEVVEGSSTIDSISRSLHDCHGLHLVAHGTMNPETQRGSLVLEDKDGHRAFAFDDNLNTWIYPNLRAVVLQSCQSAAPTPKIGPPFVGIGPKLVELGVPAVVAMQDYVAMDDARVFAAAFYRSLVRDGVVDVAVNEGRQAIFQKSSNDNFSIPVLFMRLKGGLLWRPDPLRSAVVAKLGELEKQPEHALPTRAIQSLGNSLDYDAQAGPAGPMFDTPAKLLELSTQDKSLVLLVGPRGMAKGPQLQWIYRKAAQRFLDDDDGRAPAPVSLALKDILGGRGVLDAIDRSVSALAKTPPDDARVSSSGRPLILIIDGDSEVTEDDLRDAQRSLQAFRASSAHRIVMTLDEGSRAAWDSNLVPTAVLVARPMAFDRVCQHLKSLGTTAASDLHAVVERRRCQDVTGMPWLLERMLALSQRKVTFDSSTTLLRQIAGECLSSISMGGVPRACAERALEQIGWRMQWGRRTILGGDALYQILAAARDPEDGACVGTDRSACGLRRTGRPQRVVTGDDRVAIGVGRHPPLHSAVAVEPDERASLGQRHPGALRRRRDARRRWEQRRAEQTTAPDIDADDARLGAACCPDRPDDPACHRKIARPLTPDPNADVDPRHDPARGRVDLHQAVPGQHPDRAAAFRDRTRKRRNRNRARRRKRGNRHTDDQDHGSAHTGSTSPRSKAVRSFAVVRAGSTYEPLMTEERAWLPDPRAQCKASA